MSAAPAKPLFRPLNKLRPAPASAPKKAPPPAARKYYPDADIDRWRYEMYLERRRGSFHESDDEDELLTRPT